MSYRDDRQALLDQAEALRRELAAIESTHLRSRAQAAEVERLRDQVDELRAENRALRAHLAPGLERSSPFSGRDLRSFAIAFGAALAIIALVSMVATLL